MLRLVYILVTYLLLPLVLAVLLWRSIGNPAYRARLGERFGLGPRVAPARGSLWLHAVSVGEVQASAPLVFALHARDPDTPIVLTTVTPTGRARAKALFGDRVTVCYAPYDLAGAVRRFFDRAHPRLAVILETEIWPNLYRECGVRRVPLVLASARISRRSLGKYRRLVPLFRETLSHGIVIAAQSAADAERFRSLGAPAERTHVTGNIKFDFRLPDHVIDEGRAFRERYAAFRPVWVAASTHAGEEEIVLDAHRRVLDRSPEALLLLVPRHPERFDAVAALVQRRGFEFARRSSAGAIEDRHSVFIVDTLGELPSFYAASDVALVAGSLVPVGGHNLLEPAALGLPVLVGPHTFNSEEIAAMFADAGASRRVNDADTLAEAVTGLLADPAERRRMGRAGTALIERNRGTVERLLSLVEPLLDEAPRRARR